MNTQIMLMKEGPIYDIIARCWGHSKGGGPGLKRGKPQTKFGRMLNQQWVLTFFLCLHLAFRPNPSWMMPRHKFWILLCMLWACNLPLTSPKRIIRRKICVWALRHHQSIDLHLTVVVLPEVGVGH